MMERENINNNIADDLELRNRNWGQIEGELADRYTKVETDGLLDEKATVTELNNGLNARYTKDETDGLLDKKANRQQEDWIKPTLLNGATGNIRYRKTEAGSVQFQGEISNLPPILTPFMTWPTTYFSTGIRYPIARGSNGINVIRVDPTGGGVMLNSATTSSYLNFDITEVFI